MRYLLSMDSYSHAVLAGLLRSALDDADRDGRSGPWVDAVRQMSLAAAEAGVPSSESGIPAGMVDPLAKTAPVGGEAFGTKVTFWSDNWGVQHALIVSSPRPVGQRTGWLEPTQWGIVQRFGGMTFVDADQLTLGWHPDAD